MALLAAGAQRRSTLLIAPTGAGKTLAGFLPSLVNLAQRGRARKGAGLHTLYISPLKALAVDVARNLRTGRGDGAPHPHRDTHRGYTARPPQRQRAGRIL
jgi:ATP-dependent Lhr-like helicase